MKLICFFDNEEYDLWKVTNIDSEGYITFEYDNGEGKISSLTYSPLSHMLFGIEEHDCTINDVHIITTFLLTKNEYLTDIEIVRINRGDSLYINYEFE